ncbi:MAG: HD domain-containing protein, partial [Lachnospiraceae bacterium]|nr:HD domain-containing protein [Lachnospiraceae bacterium]
PVIAGVALNTLLSYLCTTFKIPLWLDTIGTIIATVLGGMFVGLLTSVLTSVICTLFITDTIYYTLAGVLIVICTDWFYTHRKYQKKINYLFYIINLALIGGFLGAAIQLVLIDSPRFITVEETSGYLSEMTGMGPFMSSLVVLIALNLVDKGLSVLTAVIIIHLIPKDIKDAVWRSVWKQRPLPTEDMLRLSRKREGTKRSMQGRLGIMLTVVATSLTLILSFFSINTFYESKKDEYRVNAKHAAAFAADVIDPDKVNDYIKKGRNTPGYEETEELLYHIRDNAPGVNYLYVIKIREDGCYVAFDLDSDDLPAHKPGDKIEFEKAFEEYLPALFAGKEIPEVESNDISGWVLTAYHPVVNADGKTVCYAAADVSMEFLSKYASEFLIKILILFSGFFIMVIGYGLWVSRYSMVYPIGEMTDVTNDFLSGSMDQKELDNKVKDLRSINIRTGDEVEALYYSISKMASGIAEQMREVRYYADTTSQMQNGLIITMANMVEDRDSDTGAHVQKTSAYVKIIAEGLKRKGYYAHKLTPKYMSDIVMSAPLHDVGKINISDAILNKPGKLTDEEYEIMKTHTTVGKKIMENAISTVQGENYLKEARNMAAYHHERWDGKGYPEGLHGEVIPLSARIMAVADVFDALSSPRVYKPAFPLEKALAIITEGSGTQFDPKCVEVFMESLPEVKAVLRKYQEG